LEPVGSLASIFVTEASTLQLVCSFLNLKMRMPWGCIWCQISFPIAVVTSIYMCMQKLILGIFNSTTILNSCSVFVSVDLSTVWLVNRVLKTKVGKKNRYSKRFLVKILILSSFPNYKTF
jgi:hypothetical protein